MNNNFREEKEVFIDGCINVLSLPSKWKAITPKKNDATSEIIVFFIPPKASYHIILKYDNTKHCELFFQTTSPANKMLYIHKVLFSHM